MEPRVSLYIASAGVPAFHQKSYPKRRPSRPDRFRATLPFVTIPVAASVGDGSDLSYEQFLAGDFDTATLRLRA
jgi:hypothetical protein